MIRFIEQIEFIFRLIEKSLSILSISTSYSRKCRKIFILSVSLIASQSLAFQKKTSQPTEYTIHFNDCVPLPLFFYNSLHFSRF